MTVREEGGPIEDGGLLIYDNWIEAQTARLKAWENANPTLFPLTFYSNELVGEIGEACNVIKKLDRERAGAPGSRDTVAHLGEELADGLIAVRNLAIKVGAVLPTKPTVYAKGKEFKTLSDFGSWMAIASGEVSASCLFFDSDFPIGLWTDLSHLEFCIRHTAAFADIADFDQRVIDKWNATSLANGFPHRIERKTYSLEETFE